MTDLATTLRSLRRAVVSLTARSGVATLVGRSRWRANRLLILCYHGVSLADEHLWHPDLFVTPAFLRRRLALLRQVGCNVLPLGEAVRRLAHGTLPAQSVVITFDDGFYNFHAAALPILREFAMPATVYISTYHCINQRPILGLTVPYLLWKYGTRAGATAVVADKSPPYDALALLPDRLAAGNALLAECRKLSADRERQAAWLAGLAARLGVDWEAFNRQRLMHLMSAEEVAQAAAAGIDVALHTHRHRTPRDGAAFRDEIRDNQAIIQSLTGRLSHDFCYPSGVVYPEFLAWERELGIASATTCVPGLAAPGSDALLLPRFIDTMGQPESQFIGWLTGINHWLSKSREVYAPATA